jgi:hypothetical protein
MSEVAKYTADVRAIADREQAIADGDLTEAGDVGRSEIDPANSLV